MSELPDLREDLEIARAAVCEAGDAVMAYYRTDTPVHFKQADQPVTAADLAADRILHDRLAADRPEYGWLSEESAASADRLELPRVWVVDPIDGTNSFVLGIPEFVVSLGLVEGGVPVLGVLYNPVTRELYHAARGRGAYLGDRRIRVAAPPPAGESPVLLASRWEIDQGRFSPYDAAWTVRPLGSTAYRMLKVADGTAHAFFSRGAKSEWDVCAAAVVVEEAGGHVHQIDGTALRFNQRLPRLNGIVCRGSVPLELLDAPE